MTEVFLFGTLCHAALLRLVAGGDVPQVPAQMPDACVAWAKDAPYPVLLDTPGATASGLLISPGPEALARIDFYEACFGYHRVPVAVQAPDGLRQVQAWRPREATAEPGAAWSLADWVDRWGELSILAAAEVMRQFGHADPQEIGHRFWMIRARAQSFLEAGHWARPGKVGHGLTRADVETLDHRFPYDRFFTVEELRIRNRQFDGSLSTPQERAVFRVADAVTVLPYDPVRDRILLVEQVRLGAYANGDAAPWMLEPVAGIIDAGETPRDSARREAVEEAGLDLEDLHHVARYYPSPGGIAQVITSFVGIADLPDGVAGIGGLAGEGEDILSHLVAFDLAEEMLAQGDMVNAPLILSMQWLQLNRQRLRASA